MRWHLALILTAVVAVLVLAIMKMTYGRGSAPWELQLQDHVDRPVLHEPAASPLQEGSLPSGSETPFSSRRQRSCFDYRDDDGGPAVFYRVADGRWVNQSHGRIFVFNCDHIDDNLVRLVDPTRNNLTIDLRSSGQAEFFTKGGLRNTLGRGLGRWRASLK